MHIGVIDGDVSYPATNGKRLRTLNLLVKTAAHHRITYIGRCAPGSLEARLAPSYLRDRGIDPIIVDDPMPQKSGVAFYARACANLVSPLPLTVALHTSAAMRRAVSAVAARGRVDVWQVEWPPYVSMLPAGVPGARVLMAPNVDSLLWRRYYETETSPARKIFFRIQWRRFERLERAVFQHANRVVAVSEPDARMIREEFGQPAVDVVENGIDRAYFEEVTGRREASRILFLGSLDWFPNLDAIDVMLDSIFPQVRRAHPAATLVIVGRRPPARLAERVRQTSGVELHGDVDDVRPFMGDCGVIAVPLRIGGGSRLKILEAAAAGLPVVASAIGAEGLRLKPGVDFVLADEDDMADALVRAIRAPAQMRAMAERARALVLETYDWGVLARQLEASWGRSLQEPHRTA